MSQSQQIIEITKDTPELDIYLERLAEVSCLAFANDPLLSIASLGVSYEQDPKIHMDFHTYILRVPLLSSGRLFVVFVGGTEPVNAVGFIVAYEPGKEENWEHPVPGRDILSRLQPEIRAWRKDVMIPAYQSIGEVLGENSRARLLHLDRLAIHPGFHRRGLGAALVNHMLETCDPNGVGSCVETANETNLRFYTSFGYRIKSQTMIPSSYGDITMWFLSRDSSV